MAQEVNVAVLQKQITDKLNTLETAVKAYRDADKKHDDDRAAAHAKYEKEFKAWSLKATKLVLKQLTVDNVTLNITNNVYHNSYRGVNIEVKDADLSALGERPVNNYEDNNAWRKIRELHGAIPNYYDNYGRQVSTDAVIFHFKKSLDMIAALPKGTTTITVKDFNFLTKF
jgi:hypothetical protein